LLQDIEEALLDKCVLNHSERSKELIRPVLQIKKCKNSEESMEDEGALSTLIEIGIMFSGMSSNEIRSNFRRVRLKSQWNRKKS